MHLDSECIDVAIDAAKQMDGDIFHEMVTDIVSSESVRNCLCSFQ